MEMFGEERKNKDDSSSKRNNGQVKRIICKSDLVWGSTEYVCQSYHLCTVSSVVYLSGSREEVTPGTSDLITMLDLWFVF